MSASPERTLLVLAVNPFSTPALALYTEKAQIRRALRRRVGGRRFRVVDVPVASDDDLRRALLDHQPEVVHFSGHGTGRKGLVFEETGGPLLIAGAALADLFRLCSSHVRCVVLNACFSEVQAAAISRDIEVVIGMSHAIGDAAAIKFSVGFYDALASGRTFAEAFQFGCNAISLKGIPESLTPVLMVRNQLACPQPTASHGAQHGEPAARVHQGGQAADPSLHELIAILDFRADMILSAFERESADLKTQVEADRTRNLVVDGLATRVREAAQLFAQLHEQNKRALLERAFVHSHEITGRIHRLLEGVRRHIDGSVYDELFPGMYACAPPRPWWSLARDYPGELPARLAADPCVGSLAQCWAETAATAASEPDAEVSTFFDDLARLAADQLRRQGEERQKEERRRRTDER